MCSRTKARPRPTEDAGREDARVRTNFFKVAHKNALRQCCHTPKDAEFYAESSGTLDIAIKQRSAEKKWKNIKKYRKKRRPYANRKSRSKYWSSLFCSKWGTPYSLGLFNVKTLPRRPSEAGWRLLHPLERFFRKADGCRFFRFLLSNMNSSFKHVLFIFSSSLVSVSLAVIV